jgi:hypothetical protein
MGHPLNRITLVTFTYPNDGADVIFKDWIEFVGDTLASIMVVSPACFQNSPIFQEWKDTFPSLELLFVGDPNEQPDQYYALGVLTAMEQVPTEFCLFVKLDVLPFRYGSSQWADEAIEQIKSTGAFALTGSERWPNTEAIGSRYGRTHRISLNFALYRPKQYLAVLERSNPEFIKLARECKASFSDRFRLESCIEQWLEQSGGFNLVRQEDLNWSVFHIHQFDEALSSIRVRYRERVGIEPFLNRIDPYRKEPWEYHPWERYYGMPSIGLLKRIRIHFGALRHRLFGGM